jgi:hypothetical protein
MALGGALGVHITALPHANPVVSLFAESTGRFVCELDAADIEWFTSTLGEPVLVLGSVTDDTSVSFPGCAVTVDQIRSAFTGSDSR